MYSNTRSTPAYACDQVPGDSVQFHLTDHVGHPPRVWLETNTKYANTRTTVCLALAHARDLHRKLGAFIAQAEATAGQPVDA